MPNVTVQATFDSPTLTVPALLKDPLMVPTLILSDVNQLFVAEKILRNAGSPQGGTVVYYESSPLFADNASEFVEEYGEIPVTTTSIGTPKSLRTRKRALGVRISQEMVDRNQVDRVNLQIQQVRNQMVNDWDAAFISAVLNNASVNTKAVSTAWATSTTIRKDIFAGAKLITDAKRGFDMDTLVVNPSNYNDLLTSAEIQTPYTGNAALQNPALTGTLDFGFAGLNVVKTYAIAAGTAIGLQSQRAGFYADERPLQATPLYMESKPNETWRSDVLRTSCVGLDQPLAVTLFTGI